MSLQDWQDVEKYKEGIIKGDVLASIWQIDDIKQQAEDRGKEPISDEDARNILYIVERRHDACIGINWDVIDFHIDSYFQDKAKEAAA